MNKKKLIWQIPFLALLIIGTVVILKKQPPFRTNEGLVFGTVYKITYQHDNDLHSDILGANNAQIHSIWLNTGHLQNDSGHTPTYTIDDGDFAKICDVVL